MTADRGGGDRGASVLLVDDEERILSALRRSLRREGYRLRQARSAQEALAWLERERFDAVVSDQKMPGASGGELLDLVARRWPETARLLLTGWPEEIGPARVRALGLHAVILKPWDDAELKRQLREAVARARGGGKPA